VSLNLAHLQDSFYSLLIKTKTDNLSSINSYLLDTVGIIGESEQLSVINAIKLNKFVSRGDLKDIDSKGFKYKDIKEVV
jgi:hypothetical protein